MITTSKSNSSIAFNLAIFGGRRRTRWGPRVEGLRVRVLRVEDKGGGPRVKEHKDPFLKMF